MNPTVAALASEICANAAAQRLDGRELEALLAALPGWAMDNGTIRKTYHFTSYARTIGFVNVVAWIAEGQDHHPDLAVGYAEVTVTYSTHSAGGLTRKDIICAARIEAMLDRA